MGRMKDYLLSLQEKEHEEELKQQLKKEKSNRVQYKPKEFGEDNNGGV